jgi:hypothetical protein
LCDAFSLVVVVATEASVFTEELFATNPNPPSVTSVASVRCFPISRASRTAAPMFTEELFATNPNPPP